MKMQDNLFRLRTRLKLSQAEFAEQVGVTQQTVQKWESGSASPSLEKLILLAKKYGLTLDALVLGADARVTEETVRPQKVILPLYEQIPPGDLYCEQLRVELLQSEEEGLDLSGYAAVFEAVAGMPRGNEKKRMADLLFEIVRNAPMRKDYPYVEPSGLAQIRELAEPYPLPLPLPDKKTLSGKILGAWMGRVCGCLLGKAVEGVRTDELIPFLKQSGNYPLHRYIVSDDILPEKTARFSYRFYGHGSVDVWKRMPWDDDTNYTILYQELIRKFGRDFTPADILKFWLEKQPKNSYCTAERVAFCNAVNGYFPPDSACYQNPFREWIGAQIRADYFGYINPGDPDTAAEMAFRDASISHVKNGIYGEMFVAAMIAAAASCDDTEKIIRAGLARIPATSRLFEKITTVLRNYREGTSGPDCFASIHRIYDEHRSHDWCHTIPNAMIVVASLLYGKNDFGRSICMAVEAGFDTDCNGATVGSILGMKNGIAHIGEEWTGPLNDTLETTVFGVGTVRISERAAMTMEQIRI